MIFHDWTLTDIIPSPDAWYQYQPGGSAGHVIYDSSGNERTLEGNESSSPVLATNILGGHPAWYFDGAVDPLVYTGSVTLKHVFILASNEDATFDGFQGLLTGPTTGDVLVGDDGTTKFFDLGISNLYSNAGTSYDEDNQQAPMSGTFRLLEVKNSGGITLDGIQIGQQRALTARKWQGHFVEMIGFERVLSLEEIRQVRLYFNIKFGEFKRGLPFYFPSADIVPVPGPSRFYDVPQNYKEITDTWTYEDATKDFNEVADDAPKRWEYNYSGVTKQQKIIFDEFWRQARLINPFYFKDREGLIWSNVRVEEYNRNHPGHMRWKHEAQFNLVGYNSTSEPDETATLPDTPTGLTVEHSTSTSLIASWDAPPDTEAPSVPVMTAATGVTGSTITWNWNAATDDTAVTNYDLQVAEDAGFSVGLVTIPLGNVLTYNNTGLDGDTTYYARVRAKDAALNASAYSSSVNETTSGAGADLLTNLISYWPLDEASGNALDVHGANDLTDTNTVGAAAGKVNGARDFELANTEYFTIADNADVSTGDIDWSIQAWVNLESTGTTQMIVAKDTDGGGASERGYILYYNTIANRFSFDVFKFDGSLIAQVLSDTFGALSTGTWYLVHAWHDATNDLVGISVNGGTPDTDSTAGVAPNNGNADFRIGGRAYSGFENNFDGLIDEVALWKRLLTDGERVWLYNAGTGREYGDLG